MILSRFFSSAAYVAVLLLAAFLVGMSGCESKKPEQQMRIGMNTWPGYEPFVLAKEEGFLGENVKISRVGSATDVIKAFRSDIIDVACVTLDEALTLADSTDEGFKIITMLDFSDGADAIIAHKSIRSIAELKGKRVGVESSALGAFMFSRAMELTPEVSLNDIDIVTVGYADHEEAFLKEKIDAVVTFEPVKTKLLAQGGVLLFDSSRIPGEIVDVMIVKDKTIKMHRDAVAQIVDGWYRSVAYIKQNYASAMKKMAAYEEMDIEAFMQAHGGLSVPSRELNREFLSGSDPKIVITMEKLHKILLENGIITHKMSMPDLITDSFVN